MDGSRRYFMNKNEILENTEQAFEEEQFLVYFQPQYNYTTKRIIGAEALVRWPILFTECSHPEILYLFMNQADI